MAEIKVQKDVRQFYDEVGWCQVGDGIYQNAQYEDLRPVSREYIHKCHLRINRYLHHSGKYLLDAGSGPIQYPEYMTYSEGYQYRVCLDISIVALKDARARIKDHGLFVVADIAYLPFKDDVFDDIVSLHTLHHLPPEDYRSAYFGLKRVLKPDGTAAIVNGWSDSALMRFFKFPMLLMEKLFQVGDNKPAETKSIVPEPQKSLKPEGTFVYKLTPASLRQLLGDDFPLKIRVWRSVSVRFLRAMVQPDLAGKLWLKLLFFKEELLPGLFGVIGQYPLITFIKN